MEVHSQPAPYVTFRGVTLPKHAYVDLNEVMDAEDGVQCHTDLQTCCSRVEDLVHRGDWYFPTGVRLGFATDNGDIYQLRLAQRVDLHRRNNATSPSGVYRCENPTLAVNDDNDRRVREMVYVGLYGSGGTVFLNIMHVTVARHCSLRKSCDSC